MKKIPTMFERDWEGDRSRVTDQVSDGCGWVLEGIGEALRKYDGTCLFFDGDWWARRELRPGVSQLEGFRVLDHDPVTDKTIGWMPIETSPFHKFFMEAIEYETHPLPYGTYELIGPKVQGNPEQAPHHTLVCHADAEVATVERSYRGIEKALKQTGWEGFVFYNPDGRMAKIKARDFGIKR